MDTHIFRCDLHTHSRNSHDAVHSVAEMAKSAIEKNISAFAITDHCDMQYFVERDMPACIANSVAETAQAAADFAGKVTLLKGVEIGEGIWLEEETKALLQSHDFDVIIGSVHEIKFKNYRKPYSLIDFTQMSSEEIPEFLNMYFDDLLETLKKLPCDVMAHLTCPFRYINGKYHLGVDARQFERKIDEILRYIIDHSIALEINTSGVAPENGYFMPDEWIVEKYKNMGGYLVTIGSDAHIPDNLGKGFDEAVSLLRKYHFTQYYYYKNRKSIPCAI